MLKILAFAALNLLPLQTALADDSCHSTYLDNASTNLRLDFAFCPVTMVRTTASCTYSESTEVTHCTLSNGSELILDWYGRVAHVFLDSRRVAKLTQMGPDAWSATLVWKTGDVDTCNVRIGAVEWCE